MLNKLKAEKDQINNRRAEITVRLNFLKINISSQYDVSLKLKQDNQNLKIELSTGIIQKAEQAANSVSVVGTFRNSFIQHVVNGLNLEVEHNLNAGRFKLVDSDNKILLWQTEECDLKSELLRLDRRQIKLGRKIAQEKILVQESLNKLEERLCAC